MLIFKMWGCVILAIVSLSGIGFGRASEVPKLPGELQPLPRTGQLVIPILPNDTLPTLPYSSLYQLLECFGLANPISTIEFYITEGSLSRDSDSLIDDQLVSSFFETIHEEAAASLKKGLVRNGNGQHLCGHYAANANAALGSSVYLDPDEDCLFNGDLSFHSYELADGFQTILCGELSAHYAKFLDGYMKMYMIHSVDTPFDGYIDFGPLLGRGTCVISTHGIKIKLPPQLRIGGIYLQFK